MRSVAALKALTEFAALAALTVALFVAAAARAGVEIETRTEEGSRITRGLYWLDGNRLRSEHRDGQGGESTVIFRGDRSLIWSLESSARRYAEIDEQLIDDLAEKLGKAREELDARLANIPPEKRALFEKMLKQQGMSADETAPADHRRVVKTHEMRQVGGRTCRVYRLTRGGNIEGDICVVDWSDVGLERRELVAFRDFGAFLSRLMAALPGMARNPGLSGPYEIFEQLDGFPIETRQLAGESVRSVTRYTRFERREVDPTRFELPEGYAKRELGVPSAVQRPRR